MEFQQSRNYSLGDMVLHYVSYEYYSKLNTLSSHMHPFPTIMIVDKLEGECIYCIGKDHISVSEGDILLVNPGIYHCKMLGENAGIYEVHLAFENVELGTLPINRLVFPDDYAVVSLSESELGLYRQTVDILKRDADFESAFGEIAALGLCYQFLAVVLRSMSREHERTAQNFSFFNGNHDNIVNSLREFLIENYQKNITLSVVAKNMYLSPEYLSRIFKAEIGKSPYTFLIELRINKAKELLESTDIPIHTIALQVGYSDAYHFSKQFKRLTSLSPSEYRKLVQSGNKENKEL